MRLPIWLADRLRPRSLGERGERAAARYLRRQGYKIVAMRERMRYGEIDLVAVEGRTVVFVEVKTRRSGEHGRPALAVNDERRQRLSRAAIAFLKSHNLLEYKSRFDVIEVIWPAGEKRPTITHHENAFPAEGRGQFFR